MNLYTGNIQQQNARWTKQTVEVNKEG